MKSLMKKQTIPIAVLFVENLEQGLDTVIGDKVSVCRMVSVNAFFGKGSAWKNKTHCIG